MIDKESHADDEKLENTEKEIGAGDYGYVDEPETTVTHLNPSEDYFDPELDIKQKNVDCLGKDSVSLNNLNEIKQKIANIKLNVKDLEKIVTDNESIFENCTNDIQENNEAVKTNECDIDEKELIGHNTCTSK